MGPTATVLICPHCSRQGGTAKVIKEGTRVRCPGCGLTFAHASETFARPSAPAPVIAIRTDDEDSPARSSPPGPRPKPGRRIDPVVLIGVAVPSLILLCFSGYLLHERAERSYRSRVVALKAEADRLAAAGHARAAFEKYSSLLVMTDGRADGGEIASLADAARRARVGLADAARAEEDAARIALDEAKAFERREALERALDDALEDVRSAIERVKFEHSSESIADMRLKGERMEQALDRIMEPYRPLIEQAAGLYPNSTFEIGSDAHTAWKLLREKGISSDIASILRGGIFLMEHTHYPEFGRPGSEFDRQSFRAYTAQYQTWRSYEKLSHDETIRKLYDLEKF